MRIHQCRNRIRRTGFAGSLVAPTDGAEGHDRDVEFTPAPAARARHSALRGTDHLRIA